MEIIIKKFEEKYKHQCADLLQYLWKENKEGREARFKCSYLGNPNTPEGPIAVIAVNESDEVLGFRGYHILSYNFGKENTRVAYIADAVVSPNARRMGIFQKMTNFSFQLLVENDIYCISDLGPSWPPYHGNKKLGFADVCQFRSRYYINCLRLPIKKLLPNILHRNTSEITIDKKNIKYHIHDRITEEVLSQVERQNKEGRLDSVKDIKYLNWKASNPSSKYIYAWAEDSNNKLLSLLWFKTYDGICFHLGFLYSKNKQITRKLFKIFKAKERPCIVAVWCFSKTSEDDKLLSQLRLFKIPLINHFRKTPPVIVRSLKYDSEGNIDWIFSGLDIRKAESWNIDKIDADSF